jgi:hypothetical protein
MRRIIELPILRYVFSFTAMARKIILFQTQSGTMAKKVAISIKHNAVQKNMTN